VRWETVLSIHQLCVGSRSHAFRPWRRSVVASLGRWFDPLRSLAAPGARLPGVLAPVAGIPRLGAGSDEDRDVVDRDVVDSDDVDSDDVDHLGTLLRRYHRVALLPYWSRIRGVVRAERSRCLRTLAAGGYEELLATLHPSLRWRQPVLEVGHPVDADLHLRGRGLTLVPSFFCWGLPVALADHDLPPVLVYPAVVGRPFPEGGCRTRHTGASDSLGSLLGKTRAAVLLAVEDGCTTTELGRRVGVSASSACEHAAVLRNAGLITTTRCGGRVLHTVTHVGEAFVSDTWR